MKIYLWQSFFSDKEKPLLETGEIKVSIFNYESGVEALLWFTIMAILSGIRFGRI